MSTISDLLSLADRLKALANRKLLADVSTFTKGIDPLYAQVEVVVKDMLAMYQPAAIALRDLDELRKEEYSRKRKPFEKRMVARRVKHRRKQEHLPGKEQHQYAPTFDRLTEEEHKGYNDAADLFLKTISQEFFQQHQSEFVHIIQTFQKSRANTRSGRVKVDAAACALLSHYKGRSDNFACRVQEFATQVRIIVGRAHNGPVKTLLKLPEYGFVSTTETYTKLLEALVPYARLSFEIDTPERIFTASDEERIDGHFTLQSDQLDPPDVQELCWGLRTVTNDICSSIKTAWEKTSYIYAMLRLDAISRKIDRK